MSRRVVSALILVAMLAMLVAGCGGGDSGSSDSSSSSAGESTSADSGSDSGSAKSETTASKGSKAEPASEFKGKGPNSEIPTAGKEGSTEEREEASGVLEESLEARAARDWQGQCDTLVKSLIEELEKSASVLGAGAGCAKALEAQAAPAPPSALANTMTGPIDALRVVTRGSTVSGFALYHGTKGKDYVMPLLKEGDEWKVASLIEKEM